MTGSINPDGTIGPVGGIPEKFRASIDKGKKRIGYPVGLRWARAEATGQTVDVAKLASDAGVEAVELASVHDAYKLLTGKRLPESLPVDVAEMALDADTTKALDAKYKEWQQRLAGEWAALLQLHQSGRLPAMLAAMAAYAHERGLQAEQLHKQGQIAAAYARMDLHRERDAHLRRARQRSTR
jgi:predicted S18 family serine protease